MISSRGMLPGNNTISGTASISGLTGNQLLLPASGSVLSKRLVGNNRLKLHIIPLFCSAAINLDNIVCKERVFGKAILTISIIFGLCHIFFHFRRLKTHSNQIFTYRTYILVIHYINITLGI